MEPRWQQDETKRHSSLNVRDDKRSLCPTVLQRQEQRNEVERGENTPLSLELNVSED